MRRAPQFLLAVLLWAAPIPIVGATLPANDFARLSAGGLKTAGLQGKGLARQFLFPHSKYVPTVLPPASPASRLLRWSSFSTISMGSSPNTKMWLKDGLIQTDGERNFRRLQPEKSGK